jgi:hypothetical protein
LTEHMKKVGREDITEFASCSFPTWVSIEDIDVNCLSTLFIKGHNAPPSAWLCPLAGLDRWKTFLGFDNQKPLPAA